MMNDYPFSALVGQEQLRAALVLAGVNPALGGVLLRGDKGTGKAVATRGLAGILPEIDVVPGSAYNCAPSGWRCPVAQQRAADGELVGHRRQPPVVELPLGASREQLLGRLDPAAARRYGLAALQPGVLARANRGILFIDRAHLWPDALLEAILEIHRTGVNRIHEEGEEVEHPCQFLLVASLDTEDGDLRPHFLDRFAVSASVEGIKDSSLRAEIVRRCLAHERDPEGFCRQYAGEQSRLAEQVRSARELLPEVTFSSEMLELAVNISTSVESPGHRADMALLKTACTLAALEGLTEVGPPEIQSAASLVLPHRMRAEGRLDDPRLAEAFRRDYFAPKGS